MFMSVRFLVHVVKQMLKLFAKSYKLTLRRIEKLALHEWFSIFAEFTYLFSLKLTFVSANPYLP